MTRAIFPSIVDEILWISELYTSQSGSVEAQGYLVFGPLNPNNEQDVGQGDSQTEINDQQVHIRFDESVKYRIVKVENKHLKLYTISSERNGCSNFSQMATEICCNHICLKTDRLIRRNGYNAETYFHVLHGKKKYKPPKHQKNDYSDDTEENRDTTAN